MGNLIIYALIGVIVAVVVICEDCYIYSLKENVTMDTSDCLFVNSTEPVTTYKCLDSCANISTVSISFVTETSPFVIQDRLIIISDITDNATDNFLKEY